MDEKEKELTNVPEQPTGDVPAAPEAEPDRTEEARIILLEVAPAMPEEADIVEIAKAVAERAKKDAEMNDRLVAALEKEPRLSKVFMDLMNGEKSAAHNFARLFGKDFAAYEEGTPEYEDFMAGENERLAEIAKAEEAKALLDKNLDESEVVIDRYCEDNKIDSDEFRKKIDAFIMPIMDGIISKETCKALDRAINYDKDTQDAYDAGVIEGRNTNINELRRDRGDGLPKGLGGQTTVAPPRRSGSALLDLALKA